MILPKILPKLFNFYVSVFFFCFNKIWIFERKYSLWKHNLAERVVITLLNKNKRQFSREKGYIIWPFNHRYNNIVKNVRSFANKWEIKYLYNKHFTYHNSFFIVIQFMKSNSIYYTIGCLHCYAYHIYLIEMDVFERNLLKNLTLSPLTITTIYWILYSKKSKECNGSCMMSVTKF